MPVHLGSSTRPGSDARKPEFIRVRLIYAGDDVPSDIAKIYPNLNREAELTRIDGALRYEIDGNQADGREHGC